MSRPLRSRRSCLAVPGSSERFIDKARGLHPDMLFLDLEDAVAPAVKVQARQQVIEALHNGSFSAPTIAVRVNDRSTEWAHNDAYEVVASAGQRFQTLLLPKIETVDDIQWFESVVSRAEKDAGLPAGSIGLDVQIESAKGLMNVELIAGSSRRIESLVLGPADLIASLGMRTLIVGEQPDGYDADAYHYIFMRLLVAARAHDLQVLDGPYLGIKDVEGLTRAARRVASLGFDGKWAVHPSQIDIINNVFSPSQSDFDQAEGILAFYAHATSEAGGHAGAVMFNGEMLDEASRKMAIRVAQAGRAAGMRRSQP